MENEAVADAVGGLTGASQGGLEVKVPPRTWCACAEAGSCREVRGLIGMSQRPTHRVGENQRMLWREQIVL